MQNARGALLRADGVAALVGVSPRTAADLMQQMPRVNVGRSMSNPRWAVYEADVKAWLDSRQIPAETPGKPRQARRRANITTMPGLLDEHGHIPRRK